MYFETILPGYRVGSAIAELWPGVSPNVSPGAYSSSKSPYRAIYNSVVCSASCPLIFKRPDRVNSLARRWRITSWILPSPRLHSLFASSSRPVHYSTRSTFNRTVPSTSPVMPQPGPLSFLRLNNSYAQLKVIQRTGEMLTLLLYRPRVPSFSG